MHRRRLAHGRHPVLPSPRPAPPQPAKRRRPSPHRRYRRRRPPAADPPPPAATCAGRPWRRPTRMATAPKPPATDACGGNCRCGGRRFLWTPVPVPAPPPPARAAAHAVAARVAPASATITFASRAKTVLVPCLFADKSALLCGEIVYASRPLVSECRAIAAPPCPFCQRCSGGVACTPPATRHDSSRSMTMHAACVDVRCDAARRGARASGRT